ncbi:MAG: hypothetical protein WBX27_18160, partial [Specibacter sp.]
PQQDDVPREPQQDDVPREPQQDDVPREPQQDDAEKTKPSRITIPASFNTNRFKFTKNSVNVSDAEQRNIEALNRYIQNTRYSHARSTTAESYMDSVILHSYANRVFKTLSGIDGVTDVDQKENYPSAVPYGHIRYKGKTIPVAVRYRSDSAPGSNEELREDMQFCDFAKLLAADTNELIIISNAPISPLLRAFVKDRKTEFVHWRPNSGSDKILKVLLKFTL